MIHVVTPEAAIPELVGVTPFEQRQVMLAEGETWGEPLPTDMSEAEVEHLVRGFDQDELDYARARLGRYTGDLAVRLQGLSPVQLAFWMRRIDFIAGRWDQDGRSALAATRGSDD